MFTRASLAASVASFEAQRRRQGRFEAGAAFGLIVVQFLILGFAPKSVAMPAAVGAIVGFIGLGLLISRNIEKAKKDSGLLCSSCGRRMDYLGALHVALHDTCKSCNATLLSHENHSN